MLQWFEIKIESEGALKPPFFVGSMLRGAFGVGLKQVVCINPKYQCEGCFAADDCLYYAFYEAKNIQHPFRLDIRLAPKKLDCTFILLEPKLDELPYILSAILRTYEVVGFGKEHHKEKIQAIKVNGQLVYDGSNVHSLKAIEPKSLEIDKFCRNLNIEFTMPLRLKQNNALAGESLNLPTLIATIHNRYVQLKGEAARKLGYSIQGEIIKSDLKFIETERYSNRQRTSMKMGGLKGAIHIKNLDKQSYIYLRIGEIIGAGKGTVFGLGSYIIKEEY